MPTFRQLQIGAVAVSLVGALAMYVVINAGRFYLIANWGVFFSLFELPLLMLTRTYDFRIVGLEREMGLAYFLFWYGFVAFIALILIQRTLAIFEPFTKRKVIARKSRLTKR
jgi:hypothetical protein